MWMFDPAVHTLLCRTVHGNFYWDSLLKTVVIVDPATGDISSASAFVVARDALGVWRVKQRPAPRLDLDVVRAERNE